MISSCTTNQENWTMLGIMFAGFGVYLLAKWANANAQHPVGFMTFLRQLLKVGP